ncbi:MAG: DNA polymerase [Candidatus Acidiferrales bacterium]
MYDGETYEEFETPEQVIERLEDEEACVYAHNGGKFDYHYLRKYINTDEKIMLIGGRLARFRIGECEFRDSMNLFTFALAAYQKEKIDYNLMEAENRNDPNNRAIISRYLRSDCVNLYELVTAFFANYGRNLTQAGAAMRVWSHMSGMRPPKQTVTQYNDHKNFYFGGRVECFVSGHGLRQFKVVDLNSAYPDAMTNEHPISCNSALTTKLPNDSKLERCFAVIKARSDGALPFISEDGAVRTLEFPRDDIVREYYVTGWELAAALETNSLKIIEIVEVRQFDQYINFREYVDRFYALKKSSKTAGDKAQELFAKIFLNALYGKFAANPLSYFEYLLSRDDNKDFYNEQGWDEDSQWGEDRYLMRRGLPDEKQRRYNVATAASITGYVRAHLWRSMAACRGVLYCDTDSIAAEDVSKLSLGPNLGQWKLEMECSEYAVAGKKTYAYRKTADWLAAERAASSEPESIKEWKTASKGCKLSHSEIIDVAEGRAVTFRPDVPTYSIHRHEPIFIARNVRNTAVVH